jgi:hypothetical protein
MGSSFRLLGVRPRTQAHRLTLSLAGAALTALLCLGATCSTQQKPSALPDGGDACDAACANERTINSTDPCPGYTGAASPGGTSCEDACHAQDLTYNLHVVCLAQATSCTALKACYATH